LLFGGDFVVSSRAAQVKAQINGRHRRSIWEERRIVCCRAVESRPPSKGSLIGFSEFSPFLAPLTAPQEIRIV
jgi:hypothetical protein